MDGCSCWERAASEGLLRSLGAGRASVLADLDLDGDELVHVKTKCEMAVLHSLTNTPGDTSVAKPNGTPWST